MKLQVDKNIESGIAEDVLKARDSITAKMKVLTAYSLYENVCRHKYLGIQIAIKA